MYEFIFESKLTTAVAAIALLILACALTARPGFWWRVIALSFGPAFAAGFMAAILLSDQRFSTPDVLAALLFEFVILCIFCRLAYLSYKCLHEISASSAARMLLSLSVIYFILFVPNIISSGFGIFSTGTRIDYLYDNSFAKYFTYSGLICSAILSGVLARRITINRRPIFTDYAVILMISVTSILAGSKGGFVLWIAAIMAMIDYKKARVRPRTILLAVSGLATLILALALVVSDFLGITIPEFFDLAASRFFVNNDARALAFDLRRLEVEPGVSLLHEAFRSFSSLFGSHPQNLPLGVELYDGYFGPSGGAGANASLVAIIIYYTAPGYAALPLLAATLAASLFFFMAAAVVRVMPSAPAKFVMLSVGSLTFILMSQDFLAFQLVVILTIPLTILLCVSESSHAIVFHRPRPSTR